VTKLIYVVEAQTGAIKIGVSINPDKRVAAINAHSPCPCRLVAIWPGGHEDERQLHQRFGAYRSHCEWFFPTVEIVTFVDGVRGRGLSRVVDWSEITSASRDARHLIAAEKRSARLKAFWADPDRRAQRSAERDYWKARRELEREHPHWSHDQVQHEVKRRLAATRSLRGDAETELAARPRRSPLSPPN